MNFTEVANILIVDDNPSKVISLEAVLEDLHTNIIKVYSAIEALKKLLYNDFAVIILDVNMPEIDGFELAEIIRKRKKSQLTPIIFISSMYLTKEDSLRGYSLGAVDYITAPIIPAVLKAKVSVFVRLYRMSQKLKSQTDELKKTLAELRQSEERYKKVVELIPEAIMIHNNKNIIFSNTSGAKLLGYNDPKELINMPLVNILKYEEKDISDKSSNEFYKENIEAPSLINEVIRADGSLVSVKCTRTDFDYDNNLDMLIIRDITEQIRAEGLKKKCEEKDRLLNEAIQLDKMRDEFFANISHEFKTPINIIYSTLQLIKFCSEDYIKPNFKDKIDKYLFIMTQNCYRLIRLIDNLIDLTKIESGFYKLQLKNCNIVSVVENITLSVVDYTKDREICLVFDTDCEEIYLGCDTDKVERVILNLISNAIKFSNPGGKIFVSIHSTNKIATISIKDTGIGIPEDKLQVIFDRFKQIDKSLSRNREGSGLGLSIAKALIELHDGTISIKSKIDEGSEFIINLPIKTISTELCTQTDGNQKDILLSHTKIDKINIEFSDIYSLNN